MHLYEEYLSFTPQSDGRPGPDFTINVPENFNFGYDIVDRMAALAPDQLAMLWVNEAGEEHRFTFADIKRESDKCAAYFQTLGIGRGDKVMLVLKRNYEFWFAIIALHKLGAATVPATHLLMEKDYVYRFEAADIKAVVCTDSQEVLGHVDTACAKVHHPPMRIVTHGGREGWLSLREGMACAPAFTRPTGDAASRNSDILLMYFTSGTTGQPKMVAHDYTYPLGHIMTAAFWQNVVDGGLHMTMADTGWGKAVWGKLYGQWMAGCAVFTYDFDKFHAADALSKLEKYKVTSFCAPPTIYRFMIQEDISA
nr:AMP-binding protein [bacterium]